MSVETLGTRYSLSARAEGLSPQTVAHVKRAVGFFDDFMGGIADVSKVTGDDLRRFIIALQQRPKWAGRAQGKGERISDTSINTYVRAIKSFWSWLSREGIVKTNHLANVKAPKLTKKLPKLVSEDDLKAILRVVKDTWRDRALVEVLLDSGMRLAELTGLDMDDVDTKTGVIKVTGKGSKERHVYVTGETALSISCYILYDRPEPVSADRLFLTVDGHPLTTQRVQKILEGIGKKAGIKPRLSPHKLRHTFASLSLKYGSNLEYLRICLGHTDIKTTSQAYLTVADTDVQQAHKSFSPVANLGLKTGKGKRTPAEEQQLRKLLKLASEI